MRRASWWAIYVCPCAMLLLALRTFLIDLQGCSAAEASSGCGTAARLAHWHAFRGGSTKSTVTSSSSSNNKNRNYSDEKLFRTVQVQIVHRHGDRTPITPLKDEEFWAGTLIPPAMSEKIASNTQLIQPENANNAHTANGRGPFGKLTQLGLLQMVDLGSRLRKELWTDAYHPDDFSAYQWDPVANRKHFQYVWNPKRPLHPSNIKVVSTNFQRTIQSVQGVLVGLFPDAPNDNNNNSNNNLLRKDNSVDVISIDARHTETMIPDPQPRRSNEQIQLEAKMAAQPHLQRKEQDMLPLAVRVTEALRDSLAYDALDMVFGVGEDNNDKKNATNKPLAWSQLAEITKCLQVRDRLPSSISNDEQAVIMKHIAWRWFETLRHPRLAYLAMNQMMSRMVHAMHTHPNEPPVILYSAHDSTLIGLVCGFRLEPPETWPEYGSYLKVELIQVLSPGSKKDEYVVRFSLNGSVLRSQWDPTQSPMDEIPLDILTHKISTEGAVPAS